MNWIGLHILAQAAPAPAAPQPGGIGDMLVPLVGFGVIFYFLIIRPQRKKEKEHQALLASVKIGDEVITSAGIHGRVANLKEKTLMLKVAENVRIEIERSAVASVSKPSPAGAENAQPAAPAK